MYRYLVLLSLVLVVRCQICCIPQQWEGNQGSLTATTNENVNQAEPNVYMTSINVSYDALNGRIAATEYAAKVGEQGSAVGVIMDFTNGIQYTADATGCVKTSISGSFGDQTCIPNDARLVRRGRLGVGSTALNISTYYFTRNNLTVGESVTTAGCIPVSEGVYGTLSGTYFMQLLGFTGITPGIKDPSIFTPPPSCNGGQVYHMNVPAGIMKRSRLLRSFSHILPLNKF